MRSPAVFHDFVACAFCCGFPEFNGLNVLHECDFYYLGFLKTGVAVEG